MKPWLGVTILGMTWAAVSWGQVEDIRGYPGYVDLELITVPENAEKAVDLRIGPRLMRVVRESENRVEERDGDAARRILSLQIKSFTVDAEDAERMKPALFEFEKRLKEENWRPVIRMKRPAGLTNVSVKYGRGRRVDGFFIMSVNPGSEASFVNIIGDVDAELLQGMLVNVSEDVLDSLRKTIEMHQTSIEERRGSLKRVREEIEIKRERISGE